MTALLDILKRHITQNGPIPLSEYMALCLGHPEHGYYRKQDPFGADGDFITAPEISQMFGEMLGLWSVEMWRRIGAPPAFRLIELGPGRGTLMADALRAAGLAQPFIDAADIWLVETSPTLRKKQAVRVPDANWADALGEVPEGPCILLANEFFDALPVRQFVRAAEGWRERMVGLNGDALVLGLSPPCETPAGWKNAPEGAVAEVSPASEVIAVEIGRRQAAHPGAALILDYGYSEHATPETGGDTLQALHRGEFADPLAAPGDSDLSAHVNFSALARSAARAGATAHAVTGQGAFLRALGIGDRAAALAAKNPDAEGDLAQQLARLTSTDQMGRLFKALALSSPGVDTPPGSTGRM